MRRPLAVILALMLTGCGASQPSAPSPPPEPEENPMVECSSPRPQVCTMEYNPVCARLEDGGVSMYSSPCNACADDSVMAYLPGACADE